MNIGDVVKFDGANLRSASWGERVSGVGIVEDIFPFGVHTVLNIRVKDRKYDEQFIFGKLTEDKDLIAVLEACVDKTS